MLPFRRTGFAALFRTLCDANKCIINFCHVGLFCFVESCHVVSLYLLKQWFEPSFYCKKVKKR